MSNEDEYMDVEGAGEQTEESGSESDPSSEYMLAKMTLFWHS